MNATSHPSTVGEHSRVVTGGARRLIVALCAVSLAVFASGARPTSAAGPGITPGNRGIEASVPGWRVHVGGATGSSGCDWTDVDSLDPQAFAEKMKTLDAAAQAAWAPYYAEVGGAEPQPTARWLSGHPLVSDLKQFIRSCAGTESFFVVPVVNNVPGIAALIPGELKFKFMHPPKLDVTPRDPDFNWVYVQVPIAVRTTAADWRPYTVTAENHDVPPQLYRSVTVTASPHEFRLAAGGGAGETTCVGSEPVSAYSPVGTNPCSLVFKHESSVAGGSFPLHGEIVWSVSYVSSFGPPGVLPAITLGTDGNIAVAAIKALVGCTGPRAAQGGC
jgi:hypothetical protein